MDVLLECHPLTLDRWSDCEQLFGRNGACGGCWCMLWRLPRTQFESQKGDGNRMALKTLVESGTVPGLLGCLDGRPCWSVSCLFVQRGLRRRGVSVQLLRAVSAMPVIPKAFRAAGFVEVARGSPTRPIMRRACTDRVG